MSEWLFTDSGIVDIWTFVLLGSFSAMLVSLAKAGFGGSIGILSMPLMIYACQGRSILAAGIMLPLLIACDQFSIGTWRGKWDLRVVGLLLPGAILGVGLGWVALYAITYTGLIEEKATTDSVLTLSIGLIALGFVVLQILRSFRSTPLAFRPVLWQATSVGALAGLTSTLTHGAGPIVTMYMLPQGLTKGKFVASTVLYYWIGNLIKLVPYFALGMINMQTIRPTLVLLPAVVGGVALGVFLHRRVGEKQFTGVIYGLLSLAGVHLIIKAVRALWL